ncbi:MAG: tRNA (adenosine(37)-N6)-threonylcarbamoyltransferase complex ATPase subunit type 1 TsaE [Bacteroidota bacterium]
MELILQDLQDLAAAAAQLLDYAGTRKKMIFIGEIGAGKTTFIQQICKQLGVAEAVTSPTFSLVNEYRNDKNESIYHIDLYRLKSELEAIHIGIEDYLYSDTYCFVEWPQVTENLLPDEIVRISIDIMEHSKRKMIFL